MPAGDDRRRDQHGDRDLPDQRAVCRATGPSPAGGRLVRGGRDPLRDRGVPPDRGARRTLAALAALGNASPRAAARGSRAAAETWVVAIAGAGRILGIAWNIAAAQVFTTAEAEDSVVRELGLADEPEAVALAAEVEAGERGARRRSRLDDRVRRARCSRSTWPDADRSDRAGAAVAGDRRPGRHGAGGAGRAARDQSAVSLWRRPTRWIERRVWRRHLRRLETAGSGWTVRVADAWLRWRMRSRSACAPAATPFRRRSNQALQTGLPLPPSSRPPLPVWGMNWYFDTENWASGVWNSWAESRTDTWREAMARAVLRGRARSGARRRSPSNPRARWRGFLVCRDRRSGRRGRLSACSPRSTLTVTARPGRPLPRRVVRRHLPVRIDERLRGEVLAAVQGNSRPVYVFSGNHDWYDALEAFAATFLQPEAARASIRAEGGRGSAGHQHDRRAGSSISSTRRDACATGYGVPTGFQRAPFFEIQTDRFALVEQYALPVEGDSYPCIARRARTDRSGSRRRARAGILSGPRTPSRRRPASSMRCSIRASVVLVTPQIRVHPRPDARARRLWLKECGRERFERVLPVVVAGNCVHRPGYSLERQPELRLVVVHRSRRVDDVGRHDDETDVRARCDRQAVDRGARVATRPLRPDRRSRQTRNSRQRGPRVRRRTAGAPLALPSPVRTRRGPWLPAMCQSATPPRRSIRPRPSSRCRITDSCPTPERLP